MYLTNNNNHNNQMFSKNIQTLFQMIETFLNQYLEEKSQEYSPFYGNYNLEKMTENSYRLSLNVAGFKKNDITIFKVI
jgi:HSP20 family molecular chaperone IbpA